MIRGVLKAQMSATTDCCGGCPSIEVVEIPGSPGTSGSAGAAGAAGLSVFTLTAADAAFADTVATVQVTVVSNQMFVLGQTLAGADPTGGSDHGTFEVISLTGTTIVGLRAIDADGDTALPYTIESGGKLTATGVPGSIPTPVTIANGGTNSATATLARAALGVGGAALSVYAAGTAYQLTATPALLNFGTTDPSLVINAPGVWLILARARIDYTAATFAAVRTGTLKLRRTNNTAADIGNSSAQYLTEIVTTLTYTLDVIDLAPIIYTTTNSDDIIQLWGDISVLPSAGSLDAVEASIVAVKLYDQTV